MRDWRERDAVVREVRDGGKIADPLAGRRLRIANEVAGLLPLRTLATGTVARRRASAKHFAAVPRCTLIARDETARDADLRLRVIAAGCG